LIRLCTFIATPTVDAAPNCPLSLCSGSAVFADLSQFARMRLVLYAHASNNINGCQPADLIRPQPLPGFQASHSSLQQAKSPAIARGPSKPSHSETGTDNVEDGSIGGPPWLYSYGKTELSLDLRLSSRLSKSFTNSRPGPADQRLPKARPVHPPSLNTEALLVTSTSRKRRACASLIFS